LAHRYPARTVLALEANPNHARFIERIRNVFGLDNLKVSCRTLGIDHLEAIPPQDVLLHMNVIHHAGKDFDMGRVIGVDDFFVYAQAYLGRLRKITRTLVFQAGNNLWGDKARPIMPGEPDESKLRILVGLLAGAGWKLEDVAYAARPAGAPIEYRSLPVALVNALRGGNLGNNAALNRALEDFHLDRHIGEFYHRPLFVCSS
jgi:hypothetical protein